MASLKEVRSRISSVVSTQQITKAMKMVAAAKLRRAQDRIIRLRPYEQRLSGLLSNLTQSITSDHEVDLSKPNASKDVLIVVITSDRGLCGAFNTNVIRAATQLVNNRFSTELKVGKVHLMCIGKRGCEFFSRRGMNVMERYRDLFSTLDFVHVGDAAQVAIEGFVRGDYGQVVLVYNEFKNVATQIVRTEQFLPMMPPEVDNKAALQTNYMLEPDGEAILEELVPKMLRIKFYKSVLESNASEHGARMTAMDKATENAGELLKELRLTYNRTRQAAITKEILEIVGGAEALSGK